MVRGEGGRVGVALAAARTLAGGQARAAPMGKRHGGRMCGRRVQRRALPRGHGEERDADGGGAARAPRWGRETEFCWHGEGDVGEKRSAGVVCGLWDHGCESHTEQCVNLPHIRWVVPAVWVSGRDAVFSGE